MSPFEHGEVFVLDDGGEVSREASYLNIYSYAAGACCSEGLEPSRRRGAAQLLQGLCLAEWTG